MIRTEDLTILAGQHVIGTDGERIGKAADFYLDDSTGEPEWVTVSSGLFSSSESFVPLADARIVGDDLQVGYDKAMIKDAPHLGTDGHLSPAEEDELYRYYGLAGKGSADSGFDTGRGARHEVGVEGIGRVGEARTAGHDTSGRTTDTAMTRSEEELHVGTQVRESGRARLRKYVVTERQSVTVDVFHEEVRVVREPITGVDDGLGRGVAELSEEAHEIVLHEQVPVASKEVHAVERVRLDTQTVTEQQQVTDDVRKERIEMDGIDTTGTDTTGITDRATTDRAATTGKTTRRTRDHG